MKKFLLMLALIGTVSLTRAATVADIDTIYSVSVTLDRDVQLLRRFAKQLVDLRDDQFQLLVIDSTQTINISNLQKQALLARYNDLKAQMVSDFALLP